MKKQTKRLIVIFFVITVVTGIVLVGFYFNRNMTKPEENNGANNNDTIGEIPDPAGYLCHELGYKTQVITDEKGGQYGICIFPDGTECEEWSFYAGQCGKTWSYCEQNGYDIKTKSDGKDSYSPTYAVCVNKNTKVEIGSVSKLMNLGGRFSNSISPST